MCTLASGLQQVPRFNFRPRYLGLYNKLLFANDISSLLPCDASQNNVISMDK